MPFELAAPLHDLHLDDDTSFQLAPGESLAPIPEWVTRDEQIISWLSQADRDQLASCTHCFLCKYNADRAGRLRPKRMRGTKGAAPDRGTKGEKTDLIYLANLAFWLQRLPRVG